MLENVILSIGSPDFNSVLFGSFERELRTRQVVLYRFGSPDASVAPETLMAQDNRTDGCVHSLVHDYVGGYHRYDPMRPHFLTSPERTVEVGNIAVKQIADTKYAQHLFVEPGIAGKLCVILRRPNDAICLSLYRDRKHNSFGSDDLERIHRIKLDLAAAMERHLTLTSPSAPKSCDEIAPALLAHPRGKFLSSREVAVCTRLLMGYSNEAIALDLNVSFHSVRTYRRRAYLKLGVTSQNELFSLVLAHKSAFLLRR